MWVEKLAWQNILSHLGQNLVDLLIFLPTYSAYGTFENKFKRDSKQSLKLITETDY
jgi:hypothetical protein